MPEPHAGHAVGLPSALLGPRTQTFLDDQAVATVGEFPRRICEASRTSCVRLGLSVATVHQHHRVLETFLGLCERQDFPVDTRVAEVEGPKLARMEPSTFTLEEEPRLVAGARSRSDKVLVEFMLKSGLRYPRRRLICRRTLQELNHFQK